MPATEPLGLSAPLALRLASRLCVGCEWFHGIWQVLRLLGLNTTPEHHARFFRNRLRREVGSAKAARILISGTADYSLLAHILPALRGSEPRITVLDRCPTPLALNRWYARRHGLRIATKCADILDYAAPGRFDVICTHSFIGQFPPRRRARLFSVWHHLLRPNGLVLTVNRLRPKASPGRLGFSSEQAQSLERLLHARATSLRRVLPIEAGRLTDMARRYAKRMGAWPVRSEQELEAMFGRAGFNVEYVSARPVVLHSGAGLSAPTTPGGAHYACIAARRA